MKKKMLLFAVATFILASAHLSRSGAGQALSCGVILYGSEWNAVVDGLRDGLRELGLEEGKHFAMEIRDTKGDLKAVDDAARNLEREKVNLIYAVTTSVTTA
jgi:ABC-type uncharacterized transport system substrate-binding protein